MNKYKLKYQIKNKKLNNKCEYVLNICNSCI